MPSIDDGPRPRRDYAFRPDILLSGSGSESGRDFGDEGWLVLDESGSQDSPDEMCAHLRGIAGLDVDALVAELRTMISQHEPVELLSSVACRVNLGFFRKGESRDVAPNRVTWPAKLEYLLGLALSVEPGAGSTPNQVTDKVCDLVSDIFDIERSRRLLERLNDVEEASVLSEMAHMFREEDSFDRMPGYAAHLQKVDEEIFAGHRVFYLKAFGFDPSTVTSVIPYWMAYQNRRVAATLETGRRDKSKRESAVIEFVQAIEDSMHWNPEAISASTGVPKEEIQRMLGFFGTTWGSQPDFRLPSESNLARGRPAIALETGDFYIPDPWALIGALHDRISDQARTDSTLQRYWRHRSDALERLVESSMRGVFPSDSVFRSQHYESVEGHGEVDVLVGGTWPLLIEAKSRSVTPSGRRGHGNRVGTVADDIIGVGGDQVARCSAFIESEDGRAFSPREGAASSKILPDAVLGTTQIIVTLERMDPIASLGPSRIGRGGKALWVVSIADFLMVTEMLDDPALFHHYVRTRASITSTGARIFMESDALGAYLHDRLRSLREAVLEYPETVVVLGYSSSSLNDYNTSVEMGFERNKPSVEVPLPVLDALARLWTDAPAFWIRAVDSVMEAKPDAWRRWRRYRRRHPRGGEFPLDENVCLVPGDPVRILDRLER